MVRNKRVKSRRRLLLDRQHFLSNVNGSVEIYQSTTSVDNLGSQIRTWTVWQTVAGIVKPLSTTSQIELDEQEFDWTRWLITIRYLSAIDVNRHRVRINGIMCQISGVVDVENSKEYLRLYVSRLQQE